MPTSNQPSPIDTLEDVECGLAALLKQVPQLAPLAATAGPLPLRRRAATFASLAYIVTGQQVSTASASAIFKRLASTITPLTAETLAQHPDVSLARAGLSKPKIRTLRALSEACLGGLDLAALARHPAEEAHAELCSIKGIGPWTADVFLLFCAGHPDIFPAGDLALRVAIGLAFDHPATPSIRETEQIARAYAPYRGIAARLFWAWYRGQKGGRETLPV